MHTHIYTMHKRRLKWNSHVIATVYIHYVFFSSFQFNFRKNYSLLLNVESDKIFLALNFWVSFVYWFLVFLNCCYFFFFFFYSCIATTTGTTTTITSNNVCEGEGTTETSYKLWSFEFQSFGGRKEQATPKFVLLLALCLGNTYTHTYTRFDCSTKSAPSDATPHTLVFLVHGFWG